jgi:arylsulfatase A-like enzyme
LLVCGLLVACAKPRPNVLLLVMDTTRADRCSFNGYERPTTPRLAEFAADATVFTEAWSPAGWTGPAHASLFTGLRPEHHGFSGGSRYHLGLEPPTLAEILAKAGWSTGAFSNNAMVSPEFGLTRGFTSVDPGPLRSPRKYPWAHETHALAATWAEAESRAGRPFFLFINDMEPHEPYTPDADEQARFVRGDPGPEELATARRFGFADTVRYTLRLEEKSPREIGLLSDLYDAEIATLDREIGVLLDRLRKTGILDDTIVVIAGDHGEYFGEHHVLEHGPLYRAGRHVPLLVRYPGTFDGGRRVASVVRLEDVMPTVLQLCRQTAPPALDGASLAANLDGRISRAFEGEEPTVRSRVESLVPGVNGSPMARGARAVFDGRFHYVEYSDGAHELYDVSRDPREADDCSAREPAEVTRLRALLPSPK